MTVGSSIQGNSRKPLALLIAFLLALSGVPGVFAQASTAAISGVILDPSGSPTFNLLPGVAYDEIAFQPEFLG